MSSLPIFEVISEIKSALQTRDELVLEAPPGAGKTTQVPLSLLDESWLGEQKILMLEPRRLAARAAAERMAQTLGEKVGQTVGYRVRLDTKVSATTRIEVVTEGVLSRLLQDDPALESVGLLIFDEFHERSLDGDLGLALAKQGRELFGDLREQPLKLLLMSATLDGDQTANLLTNDDLEPAPIVRSQGRMFPVDIRYGQAFQYGQPIVDGVVQTVCDAIDEEQGSLLVFLPGRAEISRVDRQLRQRIGSRSDLIIAPLYGDLSLAQQRQVIEPCGSEQRKIVLATNIAETSLTIDGVRVVIDSGLTRQPVFDPNSGLTRLATQRVSRAAATQRSGRAGRTEAGVCYRLWSASQQDELAAFTPPEIVNADLSALALQLLNWGVNDPMELDWLDPPAPAAYQQALNLLQRLEAVNLVDKSDEQTGSTSLTLSAMGRAMLQLPAQPRLAHMMVRGRQLDQAHLACELAALIEERDIGRDQAEHLGSDISVRLEILRGDRRPSRTVVGSVKRIQQQANKYLGTLESIVLHQLCDDSSELSGIQQDELVGLLLAYAYPDRVALSRGEQSHNYQMSSGRAVEFSQHDSLNREKWLVILSAGGQQGRRSDRIFSAARLDETTFKRGFQAQIKQRVGIEWDDREEKLLAQSYEEFYRLRFNHQRLSRIDDEQKRLALVGLLRERGLSILSFSPTLKQWRQRLLLVAEYDKGQAWPDVSDEGLLNTVEQWFAPYLQGDLLRKLTRLSDFQSLDTSTMLKGLLPWNLVSRLDKLVPETMAVPSGAKIRIDYSQSPPVLAVKLQEMFGCTQTPAIIEGKLPLMIHLLSPARRPLQVTQDLSGFWSGSYEQVKKEMKGRYPKHPWPDDPLQAIATAKTKAKM